MKKNVLMVIAFFIQELCGKEFRVFNETESPLRITWKSSGVGSESRSGTFELQPGCFCKACIQTHAENCVHVLEVKTADGKHSVRSQPFCKNADIIITLIKESKKLHIEIQENNQAE